mgnify:FL=1
MNTASGLLKMAFPKRTWNIKTDKKEVFLTFDDGPTPEITEWTLDQLAKYQAKATFFCIGKNVKKYPDIFKRCINESHSIGNHLYAHENGWKTPTSDYLNSVKKTEQAFLEQDIKTHLLRPPYGKMSRQQAVHLANKGYRVIMWDVLSMDYSKRITPERCFNRTIKDVQKGSIIVFHDSVKASGNVQYVLPRLLEKSSKKGFMFKALPQ